MFENYRQRKRERAYQAALAAWQADAAELDSIVELASAGGWSAVDAVEASGVQLDAGERCFGVFVGASLIEPRTGPGHWQGASQGVSRRQRRTVHRFPIRCGC